MASKLDKLNELGELLKSGAITQEEFNDLKKEILDSDVKEPENKSNPPQKEPVGNKGEVTRLSYPTEKQ